jgi:hypothetical protein
MALNLPKLKISRREKRLLLVGLLAIFVFISFDYLADFLYYRPQRVREQIFHERNKLDRSQLKVEARTRLESQIEASRQRVVRLSRRLLDGDKPPVAAATLQRIIDKISEQTNIEIKSQKIDKPIEHPSVLEVPVEVVFICYVGEFKDFLFQIERHPKMLTIPKWSIRVPNHRNPKQIQVNMTISGFIKKA